MAAKLNGKNHYVAIIVLLTELLLAACSMAPKTAQIALPPPEDNNKRELQIEAVLISTLGRTVPGVQISAETSDFKDSDSSNSDGKALLNVVVGDEQAVTFRFLGGGINWTETLSQVPPRITKMRIVFKVDKIGRVTTGAIEY